MFKNKPWKGWKTRKITLFGVVLFWVIYIIVSVIFSWCNKELDSNITENIFNAGEWLVGTGCAITIADIVKTPKNNIEDCDEEDEGDE